MISEHVNSAAVIDIIEKDKGDDANAGPEQSDDCLAESKDSDGGFEFGVDYGERKSTVFSTSVNTANTIIGAGILGLPITVAETGYVAGMILFALGAATTLWGLYLLSRVMTKLGGDQLSFGRVAEKIDRRWFPLLCSFLVFLILFSVAALYLTLAANFLQPAIQYLTNTATSDIGSEWYLSRGFCVSVPFFLLSFPLSLLKKFAMLQYTSTVALIMIFYTAIIVVVYAFKPTEEICAEFLEVNNATDCIGENCCLDSDESKCCIGVTEAFGNSFRSFMEGFPVIITAFCCAPQAFNLYNDLIKPSTKRMIHATSSAILFVTFLYALVSLAGYFTYGSAVSDDLLASYPLTAEVTVARLGVAFLTSVSYPLLFIPARDSMVHIFTHIYYLICKKDLSLDPDSSTMRLIFWGITFAMFAATFAIAIVGVEITVLLNLGGSLSVANLSFTIPGIFYYCIVAGDEWDFNKMSCIFMIFFGLFIMLTNIVFWIM